MLDVDKLRGKAANIRLRTLKLIVDAGTGHTGGALSEADILTTLYYSVMKHDPDNPDWDARDRYVQSKGHAVEPLYCILSDLGYFSDETLSTFSRFGSPLIGHPNNKVPGIEMNSGALGHGLSVAVGMALAGKMDKKDYHVYCLMGDGEQEEGSVWEAAMAAANYGLDNLTAIIDRNGLQISGSTEDVMRLEPLADKYRAFGFNVIEIDGHDYMQIYDALTFRKAGVPTLVLARTIKGKGVSFMENAAKWHHGVPKGEQLETAVRELEEALAK